MEEEDMKRKKGNLRYLQMKQVLSNMPINITNNERNHRNISQHFTCDAARHVFSYQFSCVSENSSLLKFFSSFVVSIYRIFPQNFLKLQPSLFHWFVFLNITYFPWVNSSVSHKYSVLQIFDQTRADERRLVTNVVS